MATLAQARRAKALVRSSIEGAPWHNGVRLVHQPSGQYAVEVHSVQDGIRLPDVVRLRSARVGVPVRVVHDPHEVRAAGVVRHRWNGRRDLFDALDANRDGKVTRRDLARGLGEEAAGLLRGELPARDRAGWSGRADIFDMLDADRDGWVTSDELGAALGDRAARFLAHDDSVDGPALPPGADEVWRARGRWVVFPSREAKAGYMAEMAREDASDPQVITWARQFRDLPRPQREEAILRFVQWAVRYERDPAWFDEDDRRHGIELLDSAAVALQRGYGDCDVKARLFVALCLACGIPAAIDPVFRGAEGFPHVRAKVLELDGRWRLADPTIVNSTIGQLPARPLTVFPVRVADEAAGPWPFAQVSTEQLLAMDRLDRGGPLTDCVRRGERIAEMRRRGLWPLDATAT